MVFDTSVEKYFEKEWRDLEQIKHAMTEQRKLKRKRETEDEMRFGTMNPRKYSYQSTAKRFKHSDIHNVTAKRKDQFPAAGFMTSWGEIKGAPAKSKLSTVPGCRQKAQARDTGNTLPKNVKFISSKEGADCGTLSNFQYVYSKNVRLFCGARSSEDFSRGGKSGIFQGGPKLVRFYLRISKTKKHLCTEIFIAKCRFPGGLLLCCRFRHPCCCG